VLQARESILGGRWPCPEPVAVRLAAYQMQADFGDYDTALHRAGYVAQGGLEQFLPLPLLTNRQESDQYWEERLTSLHQQHRGYSVAEAHVLYLDECRRSVPLFGSHHFAKATPSVSVVSDGVVEFLDDVRYRFYAFDQLRGWQRKGSTALLTITPKKHTWRQRTTAAIRFAAPRATTRAMIRTTTTTTTTTIATTMMTDDDDDRSDDGSGKKRKNAQQPRNTPRSACRRRRTKCYRCSVRAMQRRARLSS
jgi:hypothetical protein